MPRPNIRTHPQQCLTSKVKPSPAHFQDHPKEPSEEILTQIAARWRRIGRDACHLLWPRRTEATPTPLALNPWRARIIRRLLVHPHSQQQKNRKSKSRWRRDSICLKVTWRGGQVAQWKHLWVKRPVRGVFQADPWRSRKLSLKKAGQKAGEGTVKRSGYTYCSIKI